MISLRDWNRKPVAVHTLDDFSLWFASLVGHLLNEAELIAAGHAYRFVDLEMYFHADGHFDPFCHKNVVQSENGRWYFHRTADGYRNGSFKGLDLTFGDGTSRAAVLIRGLETPDGSIIDGPSLVVDHLLARTGERDPRSLDQMIGTRHIWHTSAPLAVRQLPPTERPIYRSPRVGLSLKRAASHPEMPRYLMRPYRFVTEPRAIIKGRSLIALAMHQEGRSLAEIVALTGVTAGAMARYIQEFEEGKRSADFTPYVGKELKSSDRCRLFGVWTARFGN